MQNFASLERSTLEKLTEADNYLMLFELVTLTIPTGALRAGRHIVYVSGTDASGNAGTPRAVLFNVIEQSKPLPATIYAP